MDRNRSEAVNEFIWPSWGYAAPLAGTAYSTGDGHVDGLPALARFVSADALVAAGLADGRSTELDDLETAKLCFERLARLQINYALEPHLAPRLERQQIRDPRWILRQKVATCLDLALCFCAMCHDAHVATAVAIGVDPRSGARHAWVIVRPGLYAADLCYAAGESEIAGVRWHGHGVGRVDDLDAIRQALSAGRLVAIDTVAVTVKHASSFTFACARGAKLIDMDTEIVDVAWLLDHGNVDPLPAPTRSPGTRTYVPGGRLATTDYRSRPTAAELVPADATGLVVLCGDQGTGKTTIARQIAVDAVHGTGWFLNASSRQALIDSLARAEQNERNEAATELSDQEREGYAYAALDRLRVADDPWTVVLDNADLRPGGLRGFIPQPERERGQRVLVTTTRREWEKLADRPITLEPLDRQDVAGELGDDVLAELVAGRPLLLEAFRSFMAERDDRRRALVAAGAVALPIGGLGVEVPASLGPFVFWRALQDSATVSEAMLDLCASAALLPPDRLPLALLTRLGRTDTSAVEALLSAGLFSASPESQTLRMHRLFGAAIRGAMDADMPERIAEAVLRISTDQDALDVLDRFGDPVATGELAGRLTAMDDGSDRDATHLGRALHGLASIAELKGDTPLSASLYARALTHLDGDDAELRHLRAGCLHGRAREVNQRHAQERLLVETALGWVLEAKSLTQDGSDVERGRLRAMEGLLLQKTARFAATGDQRLETLRRSLEILEDADVLRSGLPENDPERLRSQFNLAGIRVELAKVDRERALGLLDLAAHVYRTVGDGRREVYNRAQHPHIAACENGLAIVNYYRALFQPVNAAHLRTELLRTATDHAAEALRQRQWFDGDDDLDPTRKTLVLLAKISLARGAVPVQSAPVFDAQVTGLRGELVKDDLVVAAVPDLRAGDDPLRHIEQWARSAALGALVEWFGGTRPCADQPLADVLTELDSFSDRWDVRGGKERNQVAVQELSAYDQLVISASGSALGLDPTPRAELEALCRADDELVVIVLGGLTRACLSRPLAAASLIGQGCRARRVIALGGFRELNSKELDLLGQLGISGPRNELDVIDRGLSRAFALDPTRVESEQGGTGHARWEIHSYSAELPVVAVAAPAPSEQQRANTASTLRWLAANTEFLKTGDHVLTITTHHYRAYQLADAIRELADLRLTIDAVGITPGDYDPALTYRPAPEDYRQEIRSTIRSYRRLYHALTGAASARVP